MTGVGVVSCYVLDVVLQTSFCGICFFFYDRCFVTGVVCCFVTGVGCLPQVPAPLHGDPLGQAPAACRGFTPVRVPVC